MARLLMVAGSSAPAGLGGQVAGLLDTPNLKAFFAHLLPSSLAATLGPLDGVVACAPDGAVCVPASPAHALVVPLVWAVALVGTSAYLFVKREVTH